MKSNTRFIELFPSHYVLPHMTGAVQYLNIDYRMLVFRADKCENHVSDFYVRTDLIDHTIRRMIGVL
jgi:hypothetical protein